MDAYSKKIKKLDKLSYQQGNHNNYFNMSVYLSIYIVYLPSLLVTLGKGSKSRRLILRLDDFYLWFLILEHPMPRIITKKGRYLSSEIHTKIIRHVCREK